FRADLSSGMDSHVAFDLHPGVRGIARLCAGGLDAVLVFPEKNHLVVGGNALVASLVLHDRSPFSDSWFLGLRNCSCSDPAAASSGRASARDGELEPACGIRNASAVAAAAARTP